MLSYTIVSHALTTKGGIWHLGEPAPVNPDLYLHSPRHVVVTADGDELEHIMRTYHGLPYARHRVLFHGYAPIQTWTDWAAEFILRNLQSDRTHDGWALAYLMNR